MTDAQIEARTKAFDLLTEHFNAVVLITLNDIEDNSPESERCEELHHMHDGGHSTATGMVYKTLKRLAEKKESNE